MPSGGWKKFSEQEEEIHQLYEHLIRGKEASILQTLFAHVKNYANEILHHRKLAWEKEPDELIYKQFSLLLSQIRGLAKFTKNYSSILPQTYEFLSNAADKLDSLISQLFCCHFTRSHAFDVLEESESKLKSVVGAEKYTKITDYKFCFVFHDNPESAPKFVQDVIAPLIDEINNSLHNSVALFEALDIDHEKDPPVPKNGHRYTKVEALCINFWYKPSERQAAINVMVKKGYVPSKSTYERWIREIKSKASGGDWDDHDIFRVGSIQFMQHNIVRHPVVICGCQGEDASSEWLPLSWKGKLFLNAVPVNQNEYGCPGVLKSKLTCPQTVDILDYVGGYGPELDAFYFDTDTSYPTSKQEWLSIYESRLPENRGETWGNCRYSQHPTCMFLTVPTTGNEIQLRSERNFPTEKRKLNDYKPIHNEVTKRLYFSPDQFPPLTDEGGHCNKKSLEDLKGHIKKNSAICGCPVVCSGSSGVKHAIRFQCCEHKRGCPFSFYLKWDEFGFYINLSSRDLKIGRDRRVNRNGGCSWHTCRYAWAKGDGVYELKMMREVHRMNMK